MTDDELPASVFVSDRHHSSFIDHHCDPLPDALPIILDLPSTVERWSASGLSSAGSFAFSYVVAALIVGVGLLVGGVWRVSYFQELANSAAWQVPAARVARIPTVGRITDMVGCRWINPAAAPADRDPVALGRKYALAAGLLEVTYDTGAKVIIEGPATYEIESPSGGFLSFGKLTAWVEKGKMEGRMMNDELRTQSADIHHSSFVTHHLFSVRTPTAIVTDLGTEFGVEVDRSGASRAHVFRGRIELRPTGGGKGDLSAALGENGDRPVQLKENESARVAVGRDRTVTVVRETGRPDAFAPPDAQAEADRTV